MKKIWILVTAMLLAMVLAVAPVLAESASTVEPEVSAQPEVSAEPEGSDEEADEDAESWAQEAFGNLVGMHWYTLVIIAALAAMGAALCMMKKNNWTSRRIAYAAMCIAIAFVLSCIKMFRMPQGGSVTPAALLPLILFAVACGPVQGLVVGCAYGLLQLIEDPYVIHPLQMLADYPLAFGAVILACAETLLPIRNERVKLIVSVLLGYFGRLVMAVLSGVVFFAEYAGEQHVFVYSFLYNLSYTGVEALIACVIVCVPGMTRLVKTIRG